MKKIVRLTESDLIKIVKRVIKEENSSQMDSSEFMDYLNQNGIQISQDKIDSLPKDEELINPPQETLNKDPKLRDVWGKLKDAISNADEKQLIDAYKKISNVLKNKHWYNYKVNEQAMLPTLVTILGLSIPVSYLIAIGMFSLMFIMARLAKKSKGGAGRVGGRNEFRLGKAWDL